MSPTCCGRELSHYPTECLWRGKLEVKSHMITMYNSTVFPLPLGLYKDCSLASSLIASLRNIWISITIPKHLIPVSKTAWERVVMQYYGIVIPLLFKHCTPPPLPRGWCEHSHESVWTNELNLDFYLNFNYCTSTLQLTV